jgi:hypothetical protein
MTKLFVDSSLAETLQQVSGMVELCDPSGRPLGWFQTAELDDYDGPDCPLPEELLDQIEQSGRGRPLQEILQDLGNVS